MRLLVAMLLLLSLTPGVGEAIEDAVYWIVAAELPAHGDEAEECEHSCTPLAHHCSCHVSMSAQVSHHIQTSPVASEPRLVVTGPIVAARNRSCDPPPVRPPIG